MIENFGLVNPCHRCKSRPDCIAQGGECFELRNYLAVEGLESIKKGEGGKQTYEYHTPSNAYSVPFIIDVQHYKAGVRTIHAVTVVKWSDNTVTHYEHNDSIENSKDIARLGLSMCIMTKLYGCAVCNSLINKLIEEIDENGKA